MMRSLKSWLLPAAPPSRCDWHYLVSTLNANGSVSPCCGIQDEKNDFGSMVGKSFHEVWSNAHYSSVRRLFANGDGTGVPTICHTCPLPEDQSRGKDYIQRFLTDMPRAIQKQAHRLLPGMAPRLPKFTFPPWRPKSPYLKRRNENFLLALKERNAGVERPQSYPIAMVIDPSSACSLRCPLCPVSYTPSIREKSLMNSEVFGRLMEEVGPYLFSIDFFNWGEPLLNKQLPQMLAQAKEYDIHLRLSTSLSVKVEDAMLEALVDHVDGLIVSIDGASQETYEKYRRNGDFALALSNLERIARLKRERHARKLTIYWQYLVFSFNEHQLETARHMAKRIGVQFCPEAPFVDVDQNPDWLSTIDQYVMDRYKPVRAQLNALRNPSSPPPTEMKLALGGFDGMFDGGFYGWENGARWLADRGTIRLRVPQMPGHFFLTAYAPPEMVNGTQVVLTIQVEGEELARLPICEGGLFTKKVAVDPQRARRLSGKEVLVTIASSRTFVPKETVRDSPDDRRLSIVVTELGFRPEPAADVISIS
ncbi:MAG: radical SAM protein [Acidobacteria bacterium]|nr:radical SAM protein [Acidobacteriota bacterium]